MEQSIKKEKNKSDEDGVEIIRVDIEQDNRDDDDKKDESPKTAKDLFSDFKPDSGSEAELDGAESDEDDDEPLAKRIKKEPPTSGRKKKDKTSGANFKKVVSIQTVVGLSK